MKKLILKTKDNIYANIMLFFLLVYIIYYNALPTALQIPNSTPLLPETLEITSVPLNEYFINQSNTFRKFDSPELYVYGRMEYWADNHLMLPVYRSVKTGIHLSNLGYGEGFVKKDQSEDNPFVYKSLFSSTWNNTAEILYGLIPQRLRHIQTPEQELEVARIVTKFRFGLAFIHLLGMVLFFYVLFQRLGQIYAWTFALVLILNPGIFFVSGNLYGVILAPLFLISYVLYFYSCVLQNYATKLMVFYILGFGLLSMIHSFFGSLYYLLFTWSPVLALMFFMDIEYVYRQKLGFSWRLIGFIVLKIVATAIVSFLLMSVVFYWEIQQIVSLYGREALEVFADRQRANFMHTIYFGDYRQIIGIKEFFQHYAAYLQTLMWQSATLPALWIENFMPKLLLLVPPVLRRLEISKLITAFLIFLVFASIKTKKINSVWFSFITALICFIIWTFVLNLISTVAAYHFHITSWVYSLYISLIIAFLTTRSLILWQAK